MSTLGDLTNYSEMNECGRVLYVRWFGKKIDKIDYDRFRVEG